MQVHIAHEEEIVRLFNKGDRGAYEYVYKKHHQMMVRYSYSIVQEAEAADEIVQTVFLRLLEMRGRLTIPGNMLVAYLLRSVRNQSMNLINRRKLERGYLESRPDPDITLAAHSAGGQIEEKELENAYKKTIDDLPEHCRAIFLMSRFDELTYREIAERLDISIKTVETQMGRALKKLRLRLAEFLVITWILIKLIER